MMYVVVARNVTSIYLLFMVCGTCMRGRHPTRRVHVEKKCLPIFVFERSMKLLLLLECVMY